MGDTWPLTHRREVRTVPVMPTMRWPLPRGVSGPLLPFPWKYGHRPEATCLLTRVTYLGLVLFKLQEGRKEEERSELTDQ